MAAGMDSRSASTEDSLPSSFGGGPSGEGPSGAGQTGDISSGGEDSSDLVLVGLLTRPHGIRGEIKVEIWSDVPDRFTSGRELLLTADDRSARPMRIASYRPVRGGGIVRFDGCRSRDQAEALRGNRLAVPRSEVPAPPAGLYYHFDLVGCRCVDAEHGELGKVKAVVEDGGGVLLEIAGTDRILPVPFVEAFLESVDVAGKQIRLRLPPGLVETCESRS